LPNSPMTTRLIRKCGASNSHQEMVDVEAVFRQVRSRRTGITADRVVL
jgi:hypothetical protein